MFIRSTDVQQRTHQRRQTNNGRDPTIEEINDPHLGIALPLTQIEVVAMHMLRRHVRETALPQFAHHHSFALEIAEIERYVMELFTAIVVLLRQGS